MKELEPHLSVIKHDAIEISVKKKQQIEKFLDGIIKPKKGHFVWEINSITKEVKKAEYKKNTVGLNSLTSLEHNQIVIKPNCIYIPSLNKINAFDKYTKNPNQSAYYSLPSILDLNDLKL